MDSEYPTDTKEAPDGRALEDRLVDKDWKKRQHAYEDLKTLISSGDSSVFSTYVEYFPKMLNDINAACLDLAIDTALLFADKAPPGFMGQHADGWFRPIVDKSFGSKPALMLKGQTLLLKLVEVDQPNNCILYLITRFAEKKPKIVPGVLDVIRECLTCYGAKLCPVKDLLGALGPVFNSTAAESRDQAMALLVELNRWVGKATQKVVDTMRSAQQEMFAQLVAEQAGQKPPAPAMRLRKDGPAPPPAAATASSSSSKADAPPKYEAPAETVDAREFVDEVDLGKKIKGSDFASLVAAEKWDDQQKGLQLVIDMVGPTPKLKKGTDVADIVAACKTFLRGGHVGVQAHALRVLALLADGLRADFATTVKQLNETVVLKYKEKKLVPECQAYMAAALKFSVELSAILDVIAENAKNKKNPPHMRGGLIDFLGSVLVSQPAKVPTDQMKAVGEVLISTSDDSDPKIRESSAAALLTLAVAVKGKGKAATEALRLLTGLEQSAPKVFAKIKPGLDGGASAAPTESASNEEPAAKAAVKSTKAPIFKKASASTDDSVDKPMSAAPTKAGPAGAKAPAAAAAGKKPASKGAAADDDAADEGLLTPMEADEILSTLRIPGWGEVESGSIQAKMTGGKWQEVVEALETIGAAIQATGDGGKYFGALVRYVSDMTGGFKIININILKGVVQAMTTTATTLGASSFSRGGAAEVVKAVFDKLSDKKASDAISVLFTALTAVTSAGFMFKRCKAALDEAKSPGVHENFLVWLKGAVSEFGASKFPLSLVGAVCQEEFENKVAGVRTAAIEVLGALYHQLGPRVQSIAINDHTKPQMKTLIEAEFLKVGYDAAAAPAPTKGAVEDPAEAGGGLARVDIGKDLGPAFLGELAMIDGKTSWQNRKTAMESLIASCERSGHFVDNTKFVAEVLKILKDRMDDAQANNKPIAANAIAHLIASLETEPAAKLTKMHVASALIGGLGDIKKGMRDAVVSALDILVTQSKGGKNADPLLMTPFIGPIAEVLKNPVGRLELLTWITNHSYAIKSDLVAEWVVPLVAGMQDKVAVVRTLSENLLVEISGRSLCAKSKIERGFQDLSPSVMRNLQASYTKIIQSYGTTNGSAPVAVVTKAAAAVAVEVDEHSQGPADEDIQEKVAERPPMRKTSSSIGSGKAAAKAAPEEEDVIPSAEKFFLKRILKSAKLKRLEEFANLNWPEHPGEAEFNALRETWDPFLSYELSSTLFPLFNKKMVLPTQEVMVRGIVALLLQIDSPLFMQHTDLIFRWCSYGLSLGEHPVSLLKLLELLVAIFDKMRAESTQMHDSEIATILPQLINQSGHSSERHKAAFKQAIFSAAEVVAPNKLCLLLLRGLDNRNKKSRVVCLEEIERLVEGVGAGALGRTGVKDIVGFLDNKEIDASGRNACLDLLYTIYVSLGQDMPKLTKLFGTGLSAKSLALVEERIKQKGKAGGRSSLATPPADRYVRDTEPFNLKLSSTKKNGDDDNDSTGSLDVVSPNVNAYAEVVSAMNDDDIDGIFVDIVRKIDGLIEFDVSAYGADAATAYGKFHEDAKDYIKMLQSNVKGTWHKNEESMREDAEILSKQANPLTRRVCLVLMHAFSPPVVYDQSGGNLEIDTTLASAALSTLYAFVEKPVYVQRYTVHTMTEIVAVCARWLVDNRLHKTHALESVNEAHKLIVRGINLVLLKFTETANIGLIFCALLRAFALCIPEMDRSNDTIDAGLLINLPPESTKVVVRLFVRLLNMELKSATPFSLPSVSLPRLMHALNDFFSCHPPTFEDDTPFCAAKTLVSQAVSVLGGDAILKAMRNNSIPQDNFLTKMIARLGGIELQQLPRTNLSDVIAPSTVNEALNTELGGIIDEITSAKDKEYSIKKLYLFLRTHPEVDVQIYFQRVSTTFRRFVLESLSRIEASSIAEEIIAARDKKPLIHRFFKLIQSNPQLDGHQILLSVPAELRRFILDQLEEIEKAAMSGPLFSPTPAPAPSSESNDSVALKILEGLKKREKLVPTVSDITKRRSSLTPRLDKIKGSLDDLSSSLQLSPKKEADEDDELAARLSKIKAQGK